MYINRKYKENCFLYINICQVTDKFAKYKGIKCIFYFLLYTLGKLLKNQEKFMKFFHIQNFYIFKFPFYKNKIIFVHLTTFFVPLVD